MNKKEYYKEYYRNNKKTILDKMKNKKEYIKILGEKLDDDKKEQILKPNKKYVDHIMVYF